MKAWLESHPNAKVALLAVYCFAILAGLIAIHGRGDFSTPPFIYQTIFQ